MGVGELCVRGGACWWKRCVGNERVVVVIVCVKREGIRCWEKRGLMRGVSLRREDIGCFVCLLF